MTTNYDLSIHKFQQVSKGLQVIELSVQVLWGKNLGIQTPILGCLQFLSTTHAPTKHA